MYLDYFRLSQAPFSIAPDPNFLYLSERHKEALAHLMFGLTSDGGFVLLTGEVGTGKTTLLRNLVQQVPLDQDVAFILNPRLTVRELLESLCDELGIEYPRATTLTVKHYIDHLNGHLLRSHAQGRSTVVIIDEAQNLSPAVLEQIRLLTNLETNEKKLLRIILIGQPELGEMLQRKELRQLAQRITARFHLTALSASETSIYIGHRLTVSGGNQHLFTKGACRRIYRYTKGIPRLINVLADRSLLGAYVEGKSKVTRAVVRKAATEVMEFRKPWGWWVAGATAALLLGVGGAWALMVTSPERLITAVTRQVEQAPAPPPETVRPPAPAAQVETSAEVAAVAAPAAVGTTSAPAPLVRPNGIATFDSLRSAQAAMFEKWGVIIDKTQPACDQAPLAGLRCLTETGDMDDIEELNRPVVLELWDDAREPYYAALMARNEDLYTLMIGDAELEVPREAIEASWFGSYTVLWQTPPGYARSLRIDDRGPAVTWLRTQLSEATNKPLEGAATDRFDRNLEAAVIDYQRTRGLRPDGIAGPQTIIQIHNDAMLPIATLE